MKAKSNKRERRRTLLKRIIAISLTASIVLFLAVFFAFVPFRLMLPAYKIAKRGEGELRLHFLGLDGGVTIVEFPDGEALVVNAGGGAFSGDNTLCRYLRGLKIGKLSVAATTSASSHVGGMPALYEVFDIQKTYLPATTADTGSFRRFITAMQKEGCDSEQLVRYSTIENSSGAYAVCIAPYSVEDASAEESSIVLYLTYAGVNIVLAGDITQKRENQLVKDYQAFEGIFDSRGHKVRLEDTNILCVSSHGSDNGSGNNWLSLLSPAASIICCNQNQRPSSNALARIAQYSGSIYRTDELGAVMITIKNGGYQVTPHVIN